MLRKKISKILLFSSGVFLVTLPSFACDVNSIKISDAVIRAIPPSQQITAGYAKIKNTGTEPCVLTSVNSPISKTVELHTVEEKNGVFAMRQVENFTIPAQGELLLAPASNHLMFMELKNPIQVDQPVSITLLFNHQKTKTITATVVKK